MSKTQTIIATDSEWDVKLSDPWLSTAFASASGTVVYVRDDVPPDVRAKLDAVASDLGVEIFYTHRTDATDLLAQALPWLNVRGETRLAMFFSPKDVEYALGWERFKTAIEQQKVRQRNNLSGKIGSIHVKDLCGWAGKTSLVKFAATLGVPMLNKASMDHYKANMHRGLMEHPEDFLRYAVDDAKLLLAMFQRFVDMIGTIQKETLGMGDAEVWKEHNIPMTCGALVAKTLEKWLYTQAGEYRDALKFCVRKLGILDPDHKKYHSSREIYEQAVRFYRNVDVLREGLTGDSDLLKQFFGARFLFTGLDGCSIRWWASRPITETACFNALVQGGRCLNENPFDYTVGNGLDVDISGCYGESLRSMILPVGLPTVWSYTPNETRPTLGDWLDKNERQLVDGLWSCLVSGHLSFEQDLIFSKLVKVKDIRKASCSSDDEDSDIPADLVMLRREIKNGVITSDVLNCLRKVTTNAEWQGIKKLEVVTACAYLRDDRMDGVQEWCDAVMADYGCYKSRVKSGTSVDSRSRAWYGVPLEGFVGKLVDERRRYKKLGKDTSIPEPERMKYQGLDGMLKLMVNTVYGVLASRYFAIGNTVLANNITARARVGVWMVAKALGLRQCITDGGIYTPDRVCWFHSRRPGLDTLSCQWEWHDSKHGRSYCPMGDLDWGTLPAASMLDDLAMDHVRQFWEPYGLTLPFNLEHKIGNTFRRAAYWSKADYALLTEKDTVYALRGKDKSKRGSRKHPTFALLDAILAGKDDFPDDLSYTRAGIMKIGKWLMVQDSNGYADLKGLRPGDNLPEQEYQARYNNNHFPLRDEQDYLRRRNRKKQDRGRSVQWFERYANQGISTVHKAMKMNRLATMKEGVLRSA